MGNSNPPQVFSLDKVPSQSGKVILITGSNTGIGYATAQALASKDPEVIIIAGRSPERVSEAVKKLKADFPAVPNIYDVIVDLASFESIELFVQRISTLVDRIDILINNAGVFLPPHSKTVQGFEVTIGTNVFGTSYLTKLLLPLLQKSSSPRIVILSSNAISYVSESEFQKHLKDVGGESLKESNLAIYGYSKLLNSMYAYELQNRYKNIVVNSVHPGFIKSDIQSKTNKSLFIARVIAPLASIAAKSIEEGALPVLYCATSNDFDTNPELRGKMFDQGPKVALFKTPKVFTPDNSTKVYDRIEEIIAEKTSK
jgi:retinol dehydrogenase-12